MYTWVKAFHIIFMVTWFAGLFYLPRLYVYHAQCANDDVISKDRFVIMERKLYFGIMAPAALLTIGFGLWLIGIRGWPWFLNATWLHVKMGLVVGLALYHVYLGAVRKRFARDDNPHGHVFYRWLNEAPVLVLVAAVLLAELKPWSGL